MYVCVGGPGFNSGRGRCVSMGLITGTVVPPPISLISGLTKIGGIRKLAVCGVIYNLQNPYSGLGNGWRHWGAGVLGGRYSGRRLYCLNTR